MLPEAATCFADALERGNGVARNFEKAVKMYETAAEFGDPEGMFQFGLRLFYGVACKRDPFEARKWLRRAAKLGVKRAELFAKANRLDLDAPVNARK